jgi:hypothetical protein
MKKVVCLFMICLLVSFFGLGSDALAKKKKITAETLVNTEWEISGTGKYYSCETGVNPGEYLGSMVGSVGLAIFSGTEVLGTIAPMVVTGGGVIVGASGTFILYDYTLKGNKLSSTEGSIVINHPDWGELENYPRDEMEAVLKFTKKGTFKGTVKYTNDKCEDNVITFSGKMMGQFPSDEPE